MKTTSKMKTTPNMVILFYIKNLLMPGKLLVSYALMREKVNMVKLFILSQLVFVYFASKQNFGTLIV